MPTSIFKYGIFISGQKTHFLANRKFEIAPKWDTEAKQKLFHTESLVSTVGAYLKRWRRTATLDILYNILRICILFILSEKYPLIESSVQ